MANQTLWPTAREKERGIVGHEEKNGEWDRETRLGVTKAGKKRKRVQEPEDEVLCRKARVIWAERKVVEDSNRAW